MATIAKGPYDPVKAIEGMFNGSVTRIAYALKDPGGYSGSTKTVLAECAKKFHDALDDCEIQLLDAKWYLESQLRTNKLRREAKARELGTTTKRKHDEIQDKSEPNSTTEAVAKKVKIDEKSDQKDSTDKSNPKEEPAILIPVANSIKEAPKTTVVQPKLEKEEKVKTNQPTQNIPSTQPSPQTQLAHKTTEPLKPPEHPRLLPPTNENQAQRIPPPAPNADDFAKPTPQATPQATPTGTNDDFFESMFGEAMIEATNDTNKDTSGLDFDFTTGELMGDTNDPGNHDPNSLDSFLPGLESYANQPDDNLLTMNLNTNGSNNNNNDNNNHNNTNTANTQDANALPAMSNDFDLPDLPDLGASNVWDDLLNDDSLNGGGMGGGNFDDNIDLSDSALLDLDFDSFQ